MLDGLSPTTQMERMRGLERCPKLKIGVIAPTHSAFLPDTLKRLQVDVKVWSKNRCVLTSRAVLAARCDTLAGQCTFLTDAFLEAAYVW